MIDARAARNEPDEYRRRLARKGAAEAFDAWLAADEQWRELVPQVDELRARTKVKGKPTPEQLEELRGVKEELQRAEQQLTQAEAARDEVGLRIPNPPADDVPDGGDGRRRPRGACRGRAAAAHRPEGEPRARPLRDGARSPDERRPLRLLGRRHGPTRRSRCTGTRSTGSPTRASSPSCRRCSCARKR